MPVRALFRAQRCRHFLAQALQGNCEFRLNLRSKNSTRKRLLQRCQSHTCVSLVTSCCDVGVSPYAARLSRDRLFFLAVCKAETRNASGSADFSSRTPIELPQLEAE